MAKLMADDDEDDEDEDAEEKPPAEESEASADEEESDESENSDSDDDDDDDESESEEDVRIEYAKERSGGSQPCLLLLFSGCTRRGQEEESGTASITARRNAGSPQKEQRPAPGQCGQGQGRDQQSERIVGSVATRLGLGSVRAGLIFCTHTTYLFSYVPPTMCPLSKMNYAEPKVS